MKKELLVGIILTIICLGLVIYNELNVHKINKEIVNLNSITNTGKKDEDVLVYLNTTFFAGKIMDDYYVFFGDEVQYIVKIDESIAGKINKYLLDNPEESYLITGKTKLIPDELVEPGREFVHKWLDENHDHHGVQEENHTHEITEEEFYHYFGQVYLDYENDIYHNSTIKLLIYLTGIVGALFIVYVITKKYHVL